MYDIVVMEVVHSLQDLSNCVGGVFLSELAVFTNAVEQFSTSR